MIIGVMALLCCAMTAPCFYDVSYILKRPNAIVFDLDDTLYLERDFVRSGYLACSELLKQKLGVSGFEDACWRRFTAGQRQRIFNDSLVELGFDAEFHIVDELVSTYRNHDPNISLCPDAVTFLCNSELKIGVITDGFAETQLRKVQRLGLHKFAEPILCTDVWGREFWKPHPRAFEAMEHMFGGNLVYVADNPTKDFVTPRARGWATVQINRPGRVHQLPAPDHLHKPDAVIISLAELDQLFDRTGAYTRGTEGNSSDSARR